MVNGASSTSMESGPFAEAEMWAPFEYLRGSKHLCLPKDLKALLQLPQ